MPDYGLTAGQCPGIKVRTTAIDPAKALTGDATPVCYRELCNGDTLELAPTHNEVALAAEALGAFGGGAYAVVGGIGGELLLSAGSGLTLNVADGAAVIDGIVVPSLTSTPLTDGTYNYLWLTRARTFTVLTSADPNVPPAPPSTACTYLGRARTVGGAIANIDHSGRLELRGGTLTRRTGDAGLPGDTPPAGLTFVARTAGGHCLWNGTAYVGLDGRTTVTLAPHRVRIPAPSSNYRIQANFSALGEFANPCYGVHCRTDESGVIVTHELNHSRAGIASFMLFVPGDALPGTYGGALDLELVVTLEGKGWTGTTATNLAAVWSVPDPRDP